MNRNRCEVEVCETEEQLPNNAAHKCMGNAISPMATPERAASAAIAKARAGAPVVANRSNVIKKLRNQTSSSTNDTGQAGGQHKPGH